MVLFEKQLFSDPGKLYKQEFKDISSNIAGGNSAVFLDGRFLWMVKLYINKFKQLVLKTIIEELAKMSPAQEIKKLYIKELYPYFPTRQEPEVLDEGTTTYGDVGVL